MTRPDSIRSAYAAVLLGTATAHADDAPKEPTETIVIEGQAPDHQARDRRRALDDAPFVSVLHPDEHPATASVADAIGTSAGATRRSLGGLGAFASISVRGASPGHTAVLVDGVPLAKLAQVTIDLGRFPMDSVGEVELYRGAVPLELGGAGVGGAVNLVTRLGRGERGERVRASIGGGSFGARHARVHYGDDHGAILSSTTLGYQGATGDYSFFTDNGTPLNRTDDTTLIRDNNGFDQIDAATRAGDEDGAWAAGVRALWKSQGLPGSVAQPAREAELSTIDVIGDGRFDAQIGQARARQLGYLFVERQTLRDPMAELGLGSQDRGYLTLAAGASTTWTRMLGDSDRGTLGLELRGERFTDADREGMRADLTGTRAGGAISAGLDITLAPALVITPAVRVDLVRTAPTPLTVGPDAFAMIDPRWDTVPSPRVTAKAGLGDDLAVKTSAGWYVRLPTLLELFGDRGYILGAPDLEPERGPMLDVGLVWAPAKPFGSKSPGGAAVDRVLVEAVAFGARARDTIALISTAGFVARAENVGATQTYGGELVASARLQRMLSVALSYTRLITEQRTLDPSFAGKQVPRTPGHQLHVRADLAHRIRGRAAGLWIDAAVQSTSYLDRANFARVPRRVLVGTGVRVEVIAGIGVAFAVDNLANTRVVELPPDRPIDSPLPTALSDVAGFPLPGRSFYLSFDWTH
jgi:vitamin B12 transporter